MIRPVTCLSLLLAAGSGMYLYQAKHQGYVLDATIADVQQRTAQAEQRTGVLRGEYALLNDPSRLQDLMHAYLPELAPLQPGQFTRLADLDSRLPPVAAPVAAPAAAPPAPVVASLPSSSAVDFPGASAPVSVPTPDAAPSADDPPKADAVPPVSPAAAPVRKPASVAAVVRPHPRPRMVAAASRPAPAYRADAMAIPASARVFVAREPVASPSLAPAPPASLLGMAREFPGGSRAAYYGYGK